MKHLSSPPMRIGRRRATIRQGPTGHDNNVAGDSEDAHCRVEGTQQGSVAFYKWETRWDPGRNNGLAEHRPNPDAGNTVVLNRPT